MIELAPDHKQGLTLKGPVMPATGIIGYSDGYRRLVPLEALGALVTNPMTARPRRGAAPPRVLKFPGGLLMHTGLHNPGVAAVLSRQRRSWGRSPVPVITHVVGVNVDEAIACVDQLWGIEGVAGVELGLPDSLAPEEAIEIITAVRRVCALPLIIKLPLWRAGELATRIIDLKSADAITIAAPPRGTIWYRGRAITGRLYGPAALPQSLWVLRQVAELADGAIPLIGCGGIHGVQDALAMLEIGAVAVQVDSYVWKDPDGFIKLAHTVMDLLIKDGAAHGQPRSNSD
jgi:dihydroorotate dehydrogenase (NAD+) catalytic subunit